jgi:hypothetical protein
LRSNIFSEIILKLGEKVEQTRKKMQTTVEKPQTKARKCPPVCGGRFLIFLSRLLRWNWELGIWN